VTYHITVCANRGAGVTFEAILAPDNGTGVQYTRLWHERQTYKCTDWTLSTPDIWTSELWDTQMTILVSGSTLRTGVKTFYIPN
jgi:hypothetical protein